MNAKLKYLVQSLLKIFKRDKNYCPYCVKAKTILKSSNIEFTEHDITDNATLQADVLEKSSGKRTVPQIFAQNINGNINFFGNKYRHIGGCDDLELAVRSKNLPSFFN